MIWIWRKPASVGQWLVLLVPALIAVICPVIGQLIGDYEYRRNPSSPGALEAQMWASAGPGMLGLTAATIVSFVLGLSMAWRIPALSTSLERASAGIAIGVGIVLVNALIAFAGCHVPILMGH